METRVACCGCVIDLPFWPKPIHRWRHAFPGGFHIQHLHPAPHPQPHPPPIPEILDHLLSAEAVHPRTCWEGQRSPSKTRTHYHNLAGSAQKNSCSLFSERWLPFRTRNVRIFLNGRILLFTALLQMWNLQRLAAWSRDTEGEGVYWGSQTCLLSHRALKESAGPHPSASTFPNSWQRACALSLADGSAWGPPRQAPIVSAPGVWWRGFCTPLQWHWRGWKLTAEAKSGRCWMVHQIMRTFSTRHEIYMAAMKHLCFDTKTLLWARRIILIPTGRREKKCAPPPPPPPPQANSRLSQIDLKVEAVFSVCN